MGLAKLEHHIEPGLSRYERELRALTFLETEAGGRFREAMSLPLAWDKTPADLLIGCAGGKAFCIRLAGNRDAVTKRVRKLCDHYGQRMIWRVAPARAKQQTIRQLWAEHERQSRRDGYTYRGVRRAAAGLL